MKPTEAAASVLLNGTSLLSARWAGASAFRLFHMPIARSGMRPSERELVASADIGRVELGNKAAVTYRWGSGERPVLLVHGWQSRGSRFADLVPGLLRLGHTVLTFDAPGHGDATGRSADILEYRRVISRLHEQYGTFDAVVAHSLGALGTIFSLRHGVRTEKLITISGVCDFDYLTEEFCSELALRPGLAGELRRRVETRLFPDEPAERLPFSAVHAVEHVRASILAIHDEADTRIDIAQSRKLVTAFGDRARLVVTNGLGHRRILADPEVVRTVLGFVEDGRVPGVAAETSGSA